MPSPAKRKASKHEQLATQRTRFKTSKSMTKDLLSTKKRHCVLLLPLFLLCLNIVVSAGVGLVAHKDLRSTIEPQESPNKLARTLVSHRRHLQRRDDLLPLGDGLSKFAAHQGEQKWLPQDQNIGPNRPLTNQEKHSNQRKGFIWYKGINLSKDAVVRALPPKKLAFVHLQKTGGTTFRHILLSYCVKNNITNIVPVFQAAKLRPIIKKMENIRQYDVVYGHFSYSMLRRRLGSMYHYFSVIRNPLDRLVSSYFFSYRIMLSEGTVPRMTFAKFLRLNVQERGWETQCHILGIEDISEIPLIAESLDLLIPTEMFDEGLLLLRDEFQIDPITYNRKKVTKGAIKPEEIDPRFKEVVERKLRCDVELHAYAERRLQERLIKRYRSAEFINEELNVFRSKLPPPVCTREDPAAGSQKDMCKMLDMTRVSNKLWPLFEYPDNFNLD